MEAIKRASIRICKAYGINGVCDPEYIENVIKEEIKNG